MCSYYTSVYYILAIMKIILIPQYTNISLVFPTHTHTHTYPHTHTYTRAHIHTHIHKHTSTCATHICITVFNMTHRIILSMTTQPPPPKPFHVTYHVTIYVLLIKSTRSESYTRCGTPAASVPSGQSSPT